MTEDALRHHLAQLNVAKMRGRLVLLHERGPSAEAFSLAQTFPAPG